MVTLISYETHTARKSHRCNSCLREIAPGTAYRRARCAAGGEAWTWKTHIPCQKAGEILWDRDIQGEEGCLLNVCDMDQEDREMIYADDPDTFRAVWPDRPAPSKPQLGPYPSTET